MTLMPSSPAGGQGTGLAAMPEPVIKIEIEKLIMIKRTLIILTLLLTAVWAQATLYPVGIIPDGSPVGVVFSGSVSGQPAGSTVSGLTVDLTITGGYNGDLYAYLIAPNGTLVVLMNQPGVAVNGFGASGAGMNITLSDAGSTSIQSVTTGADNFTGTYQAAGTLSSFNGSQANGNWTLFFADLSSGGGQSSLTGWSLNLTVVPEPVEMALGLFAAMLLTLAVLKRVWIPQSR